MLKNQLVTATVFNHFIELYDPVKPTDANVAEIAGFSIAKDRSSQMTVPLCLIKHRFRENTEPENC